MKLPSTIYDQHIAVLGKTRSGKSSAMRYMVEHLLEDGQPVCIIDPKGDWWGLKSSKTGKSAGYPVVIFGGEHADVPLNAQSGSHVAELIATGNRPCIIDLGGWRVAERTQFFIEFAWSLFRTTKGHRYLVIDEAHNFAPQGKIMSPQAGEMVHWANRLASEGAGKGLTLLAATQRPQKIHKDFITCCETLVAMRVIHPLDRGATKEWIDGCPDPKMGKEVLDSLASLKRGEAWIWSPEIDYGPKRGKFPLFKTYDSFAASANTGEVELKGWATVDLAEVEEKLASVVQEAEANDPKKLKARVRELEKQLAAKPKAVVDEASTAKAIDRALSDQRQKLQKALRKIGTLAGTLSAAATDIDNTRGQLDDIEQAIGSVVSSKPTTLPPGHDATTKSGPPPRARKHQPKPAASNSSLNKGERAILTVIAQHNGIGDRSQLTAVTGYKRSTRDAYMKRLAAAGLIDPGPPIVATDEGIDALGDDYEPLPTGNALAAYWLEQLAGGERMILEDLWNAWPSTLSRDEISVRTGYKRSTRDAYLKRLSTRKLITVKPQPRASDILFDP